MAEREPPRGGGVVHHQIHLPGTQGIHGGGGIGEWLAGGAGEVARGIIGAGESASTPIRMRALRILISVLA